ncbi:MAG: PA14 domain-containing protein [Burkholderiales bacterium]
MLNSTTRLLSVVLAGIVASGCGGGNEPDPSQAADAQHVGAISALAIAAPSQSVWSPRYTLPLVPTTAANLPDGKVLVWSAEERFSFGANVGRTYTATFDPATGTSTERTVTESGHNMFCPGTTNLADGRLLVNGGISSARTSIFDPAAGTWTSAANMNIARGYNANTILADGSVFTLGGSWSGGVGNKHGEIWTEAGGWRRMSGIPIDSMLSVDTSRNFGGDSHFWLIPTGHGRVLHAGPGVKMHLIDTRGNGAVQPMGLRGDDQFSVSGTAVMYDIGKVLKIGGTPGYEGFDANANAYVIDMGAGGVAVRKLAPMNYARVFHNTVVLPNGQVVIIGGQTRANAFTDNRSVLAAELFDPVTETFTVLPAMTVPRNYHSSALLLPDARVMSTGGGLCGAGCAANHPDVEILSPHYLFNPDGTPATRPALTAAPTQAAHGTSMTVATNSPVTAFSLVRMSSTTHTVNNDQRRIPLVFSTTGPNTYSVQVPSNTGVALPGLYMLFAMNGDGVPSVARIVRIGSTNTPKLVWPGDQNTTVGGAVALTLAAPGAASFNASDLPPGLSLNTATGEISGTTTGEGLYDVTVSASNASGTVSTQMLWRVTQPGNPRFVRLESLSEVNGQPWASMAEFNLLDDNDNTLPRTGWVASADSAELVGQNGAAVNALDGNVATIWHTQWQAASPPHPHWFSVDMGGTARLGGFRYTPRTDSPNGAIALFRFYVSTDGINWGSPVATGDFRTMGATAAEKTVRFSLALPNRAPSIATPVAQSSTQGQALTLALQASDPDGDALNWSANGLPPGLSLGIGNGMVSGTPTTSGNFNVSVTVQDSRGASASTNFVWTVLAAPTVINPVPVAPATTGSDVTFTASATGSLLEYAWDFGDGTQVTPYSSSPTASHRYVDPGLYNVTLNVRASDGRITSMVFAQAITSGVTAMQPVASSNIVLEPRSGSNAQLWVANPDNDTVSVFDAVTNAKLAEIAVGVGPRTLAVGAARVWVANRDGASLSVIDTTSLAVTQTIALPRASMPYGIAFSPADGSAWVALEATGQLLRLSAAGAVTGTVAVGPNPRQVSISGDGARVLVSRFVTPPLPGEATAAVLTAGRGGEVVVVDAVTLAPLTTTMLAHSNKPDNTIQGRGVPNYLGAAVISPDGASAWVPSKQDNVLRGTLRDGQNLDFQNTVRAISSRINLATLTEDQPARIDHDNASVASAAVFHPSGAYLFVALETSRQVAVVDAYGRREVMRFDAGRAPQGVAVSADGLRLYVSNFMDRSVTVHDLSRLVQFGEFNVPLVTTLGSVANERLTAQVLLGKRQFYDARDPRLARDSYMSCASCHRDGGSDGRVWDLTGLGEGLRNTIELRGRAAMGHGPLHWSGNFDELQDFEGQIRALAQGTGLMTDAQFNTGTRNQPLGDRKAGVSADLDALAAYVASLSSFAPSPLRNPDGTLTTGAAAGRTVFAAQCASCHSGSTFTNSTLGALPNIGTLKASSGMRLGGTLAGIDPPTLRDAWQTAPYLHDGSAATISAAIAAHNNVALSATQLAQVAEFVMQIGSEEPAVASTASGGLAGSYFNNLTLAGTPAMARIEVVDFGWGSGSPGIGVGTNNFSARWTGGVMATTTGAYRFRTISDDGVRLWVNGVQVINNWTDHGATTNTSGTVNLVAGQRYDIRLEYYERSGKAVMRLLWQAPASATYVTIPGTALFPAPP